MKRHPSFTFLVILALLGSLSWAGTKEEIIRLQSDILQLQQQVLQMQKSFDESNGSVTSLLEQLNDQIATTNRVLERMVQVFGTQKSDLVAAVGDVRGDVQQIQIKLDDTNLRIDNVLQQIEESRARVESRRLPSQTGPGGPTADQVYSLAFNDYLAGNFELAVSAFQTFLADYPSSEYSDNAAYYLGLSYKELGQLEQAINAFDQVANMYPNADKTASAYFKKAQTEQELQKNEEAIETFKKLITRFPDSQEALIAQEELKILGIQPPRTRR